MIPEQFKRLPSLRLPARLVTVSWRDLLVIVAPVLLVTTLAAWLAVKFFHPAPPDSIVILAGPKESSYYRTADRYAKIIARSGVNVEVVETEGAQDNVRRLADRKVRADVGFVLGGMAKGVEPDGLMSLGSVFVQPVLVFYRGKESVERLSQLEGKRIAIGPEGSGTHVLAMKFLVANSMDKGTSQLLDIEESVNNLRTPLAFADQLYVLREHIGWVRDLLVGEH